MTQTEHLNRDNNPRLLLRISEAADLLAIARSKAYAMIQCGELPSVRLGKCVRVPAHELAEFLERLKQESHPGGRTVRGTK